MSLEVVEGPVLRNVTQHVARPGRSGSGTSEAKKSKKNVRFGSSRRRFDDWATQWWELWASEPRRSPAALEAVQVLGVAAETSTQLSGEGQQRAAGIAVGLEQLVGFRVVGAAAGEERKLPQLVVAGAPVHDCAKLVNIQLAQCLKRGPRRWSAEVVHQTAHGRRSSVLQWSVRTEEWRKRLKVDSAPVVGAPPQVAFSGASSVGEVLGGYRKTHLFCGEDRRHGGWATPGDRAVVVDTDLARIGLTICFDGDFPELARVEAVMGAEVVCRPSALLRSADIWELTNRARAYDNHVFVVGANATGPDTAGVLYFGNSMIVTPIAEVVARAASHQGWVSARLDPDTAMASLTPGSSVPQRFDHLADRNLAFVERHLEELRRPARTSFPHAE